MGINIKDIIIEKRIRKDMGDINKLKKSIEEVGLLHPIVINEKSQLICGKRRLEALKQMGINNLTEGTHYRILNIEDILKGEFEENFCRKDFTPSEAVEIWEAAEKSTGGRGKRSPESGGVSGRRNKVAKSLGVGKQWLSEAKAVKDSGDKEVIEQMDSGDLSVHKAYEQVMKTRVPDDIFLNEKNIKLIKSKKKVQIIREFGNWISDDIVTVHMSKVATIKIKVASQKRLDEITEDDAKKQGFSSLKEFQELWVEQHNGTWNSSDKVIVLDFELIENDN